MNDSPDIRDDDRLTLETIDRALREAFGYSAEYRTALLNDWLAKPVRKAKAKALEEAVDEWESGNVDFQEIKYLSSAPLGWSDKAVSDSIMGTGPFIDWLRNRAQQLKEES